MVMIARMNGAKFFFGPDRISDVLKAPVNNVSSFMVGPDGSKEGWEESKLGDEQREQFIKHFDRYAYEDGSTSIKWAEVQYGDDEGEGNQLLRSDADNELKED